MDAPLCACGCGLPVTRKQNKWRHGHHFKRDGHWKWNGGQSIDKSGYTLVYRQQHHRANTQGYVRRSILVAEEHYGREIEPGDEVHHRNRDKSDDRPENLLILTAEEHRAIHLPDLVAENQGERNNQAKLTADDVRAIRSARGVVPGRVLAKQYGVSAPTICDIQTRRTWGHISDDSTERQPRQVGANSAQGRSDLLV